MSVNFKITIADKVVGITTLYNTVYDMCKDYLTHAPCDFCVEVGEEDIRYERAKAKQEDKISGLAETNYPDAYLESLAVYRKIAVGLLDYDVLLFHGSVIAVDGMAYLFTAKSGTGKSTHVKLWRERFGDRAVMVNDDKPLLRITESGVVAYGTPWDGKHHLSNNISVPLKAICILERSENNYINRVDKHTALPMLLQQSYRPNDVKALSKALSLVNQLGNNVELYHLGCNMNPEAASVAYSGMNAKE